VAGPTAERSTITAPTVLAVGRCPFAIGRGRTSVFGVVRQAAHHGGLFGPCRAKPLGNVAGVKGAEARSTRAQK